MPAWESCGFALYGEPALCTCGTCHRGEEIKHMAAKDARGFASMNRDKQREIARKGGRAAHLKGTAHEWTTEEAREAGRKGGTISRGGRGRLPEPTTK